MSWESKQFKDVVQFPPKIILEKDISYSFIPMEDLTSGVKYVKPSQEKEWKGSGGAKFEEGDTLFARITPCLQNGKISQAKNLINGKGFGSTEYFIFRGLEGVTDTDFVYYLVLNEEFKQNAIGSMVGASGRQRADAKFVGEYEIDLPPLQTQKRIASILSAYDDLIENNNKRIKILEEMAQNIYKEWFVNFRFPNYENTEFDKETGLPVGWEVVKFENLYSLNNGYAFKSEDYSEKGVNILRTRDYSSSFFINMESPICIPEEKAVNFSKYLIKEFDFLIIMVGASIGKTGLVLSKDTPSLLNQNQWAIRALESFHNYNIYKIFNAQTIISELLMKRTGAARDFFRASFLKEIKVLKPKNDLINEFNSKIIPILKKISLLQEQNQKLKEARDILLPRLMNRTIEV